MNAMIIQHRDGRLEVQIDGEVSDEKAASISRNLLAILREKGISIPTAGPVEFHKAGAAHSHIASHHRH